jgi:CheY-like chemotaxis protein
MALFLVIDDSQFQRDLIRDVIESDGHEVLEATNPYQAMQILEERHIDCLMLDLIMPQMSGLEFLQILQEHHSRIPVIVITADIQKSVHQECYDLGAVAVITKPFKATDLLVVIQQVVG